MRETIQSGSHIGLISALPKWASSEIHRLDREVADLRAKLAGPTGYDVDNNIFVVPTKQRLRSTAVRPSFDTMTLDFESTGVLNVSVMGLEIHPQAANRVFITSREWK